jgi:hypothetical protein
MSRADAQLRRKRVLAELRAAHNSQNMGENADGGLRIVKRQAPERALILRSRAEQYRHRQQQRLDKTACNRVLPAPPIGSDGQRDSDEGASSPPLAAAAAGDDRSGDNSCGDEGDSSTIVETGADELAEEVRRADAASRLEEIEEDADDLYSDDDDGTVSESSEGDQSDSFVVNDESGDEGEAAYSSEDDDEDGDADDDEVALH